MATTCMRMTVETAEAGKLRVAAGTKRVHVSGQDWKGQADRVEVGAPAELRRAVRPRPGDGRADRPERHGKADAVTVLLRHGKFERCCREAK
ncbi:MAG: hypothetical protein U0736_10140 [Gemmataceae bacterium]